MTALRLLIAIVILLSSGAAIGDMYVNPWGIEVQIHCSRGESLSSAVEKLRTVAAEAPYSSGSVSFQNTVIQISNEAREIRFKADIKYKGKIGPVLYSLLSDHGLGFIFSDIDKIDGYRISVTQINPFDDFVVMIDLPDEWVQSVRRDGFKLFMEQHLGIPLALVSDVTLSKGAKMACVRGKARACQSLWIHANAVSQINNLKSASGKGSPSGEGEPTNNGGAAPRQPPESPPPAKPGSAPQ